ncbi:MSC_0624 family F1-like ATPase-associated membrane protein [Mesomycoplasma conjunctivae]|uniref:MSC_0624 family F1-like ATPase-associated membrane protein n=1 Tax=Mesomycoplasma conjunctivae TaxID=45361 RepID=UPI003DA1E76F
MTTNQSLLVNIRNYFLKHNKLIRFVIMLFVFVITLAVLFDNSRSFFNFDKNVFVSNINTIVNPIGNLVKENISVRIARSVVLLFFAFTYLYKSYKLFGLPKKGKIYLILNSIFIVFALANTILFFLFLTTNWIIIFAFSLQIFILIIINYLQWWIENKKHESINYEFRRFLLLKNISYLTMLLFFLFFAIIFAVLVFNYSNVTHGNPITTWLETFIIEAGSLKNSIILIFILTSILIIIGVWFAPQIYFYKRTIQHIYLNKQTFSLLLVPIFAVLIYLIYIAIQTQLKFEVFLIFDKIISGNLIPLISAIIVYTLLLTVFLLTNFSKKIKRFFAKTQISLFLLFITLGFIVGFATTFKNPDSKQVIWIWVISIFYFLVSYIVFAFYRLEVKTYGKYLINLMVALFLIFTIMQSINLDLYVTSITKLSEQNNIRSSLVSNVYLENSSSYFVTLSVISLIISLTKLTFDISKISLVFKGKSSKTK